MRHEESLPYAALDANRMRIRTQSASVGLLTPPYELVVWSRADRYRTTRLHARMLSTNKGRYPALRVTSHLYVLTPAFAFLQMATELDEERLLFLGYELCGRYGIDRGVFPREQCCTPLMLSRQAEIFQGVRGSCAAARTAQQVLGGVSSPELAALAIMLTGRRKQGGYGFEAPVVSNGACSTLLWRQAKLAVRWCDDSQGRRQEARDTTGYHVLSASPRHLTSFASMDALAHGIGRALGTPVVSCSPTELDARKDFQNRIVHLAHHPEELLGRTRLAAPLSA